MKKWTNSPMYHNKTNAATIRLTVFGLILFLIMRGETPATDLCFSFISVYVLFYVKKKEKERENTMNMLKKLSDYVETTKKELVLGREIKADLPEEENDPSYVRLINELQDIFLYYGYESEEDFMGILNRLSGRILCECNLRQKAIRDLKGLKVIIFSAVLMLPAIRGWVIFNMEELEVYYCDYPGILIKYLLWSFALFIYVLLTRLEGIELGEYMKKQ